ncbi:MAG: hypothetical protein U1U88_000634 [Lawsonella clevelandensis]
MTISTHPRHTMRHTVRSVAALATTIGVALTTVPVAAAAPVTPTAGALAARGTGTPDLEPLLPPSCNATSALPRSSAPTSTPKKARSKPRSAGVDLTNSSALFGLDRNGDVTLEVRTRVDPSYPVAYFYAGVQYGCFGGVGDPKVKTSIDANTTVSVNGKWKTHATTYPISQFLQQSVRTAIKGAIAGAECSAGTGASAGAGAATCAEVAKFLATEVPQKSLPPSNWDASSRTPVPLKREYLLSQRLFLLSPLASILARPVWYRSTSSATAPVGTLCE